MRPQTSRLKASCLIALDHLDLLPQLSLLFSRVLVPRAVRVELFRRRQTKDRLRAVLKSYAFVERCDDYDKAAVEILLIERARQGVKDRGEAEAVGRRLAPWLSSMIPGAAIWRSALVAVFTEPSGF